MTKPSAFSWLSSTVSPPLLLHPLLPKLNHQLFQLTTNLLPLMSSRHKSLPSCSMSSSLAVLGTLKPLAKTRRAITSAQNCSKFFPLTYSAFSPTTPNLMTMVFSCSSISSNISSRTLTRISFSTCLNLPTFRKTTMSPKHL